MDRSVITFSGQSSLEESRKKIDALALIILNQDINNITDFEWITLNRSRHGNELLKNNKHKIQ